MSLVLLESLAPSSQNLPSAELGVSISRVAQKTVYPPRRPDRGSQAMCP